MFEAESNEKDLTLAVPIFVFEIDPVVVISIKLFETQSDFIIVDSILELFKRRESIEVFNKKALYILIKERSGNDKTQDITKLVKRVEMLYKDTFLGWTRTGKIGSKYLLSYNYK